MYLTQVIKTSILVPGRSNKHNILTGEKKKWIQVVIFALCCQHSRVLCFSLSLDCNWVLLSDPRCVVSRWPPAFYWHSCLQTTVWNRWRWWGTVSLWQSFNLLSFLSFFIIFFFSWLGLFFLYSPNAGPLPFQTYERELLSFIHFTHHKLCHVSYLIALFPSKLRRFYIYMQTLMHVDYPPPPTPLPKMSLISFSIGVTVVSRRNWKQFG